MAGSDVPEQSIVAADLAIPPNVYDNPPLGDTPPDGGYGWICVLSVFIINALTWGIAASYGVYLAYFVSHDLYPDATPIDYAFIGGINFGVSMLVTSPVTVMTRRYGIQLPMYMGVVLQTAGFVLASWSITLWQLYLSLGLLVGLGYGFLFIPNIGVVSQWFGKRRSLANGISSAGSGIGGIVFSFAIQAMIDNISLPWALRITGIVSGIGNVVATALLRSRDNIVQPIGRGFDVQLLKNKEVLLLLSWSFVNMLGYIVLVYSLSDFALSIGLSYSQAAAISAFLNVGTAVGRPMVGLLSDRFGRIEVAGWATFACGVLVFAVWVPAQSYGVSALFAILAGSVYGIFWMTASPMCAEVVGLKQLPSLLSLCWFIVILPTTFSEVVALKLRRYDSDRVYLYSQIFSGVSYLVASSFLLWLSLIRKGGK